MWIVSNQSFRNLKLLFIIARQALNICICNFIASFPLYEVDVPPLSFFFYFQYWYNSGVINVFKIKYWTICRYNLKLQFYYYYYWVKVGFRPFIPPRAISGLNMVTLLYYNLLKISKYNKKCNLRCIYYQNIMHIIINKYN